MRTHGPIDPLATIREALEVLSRLETQFARPLSPDALAALAELEQQQAAERTHNLALEDRISTLCATISMRSSAEADRDNWKASCERANQLDGAAEAVLDAYDKGDDLITALWDLRAARAALDRSEAK